MGVGEAQLIPPPGTTAPRRRLQMDRKRRVKLNAPAAESTPPAREMGVGSHRDGTDMAPRHILASSHGLLYFTAIYRRLLQCPFFPMYFPMQFDTFHNFVKIVFTLVFQGSDGFFPRFFERFFSCGHKPRQQ